MSFDDALCQLWASPQEERPIIHIAPTTLTVSMLQNLPNWAKHQHLQRLNSKEAWAIIPQNALVMTEKVRPPAGYNRKKNIARQFAQIADDESRSQFERDHAQGRVDEFFEETRRPEPQPNFDLLSGPSPTSAPPQPEMPVPNTGQGLVAPQGVARSH